jgi:hypothetical protein
MATAGTNITALAKPAVGATTGPQWATDLNTSIDAVDGHDHSSNKGIRITPAAFNVNADLDYNQNSATELKNVIFNSTVTAATTSYSLYQASGNLYWRDGSGTPIQMTITGTVNSGAGSITGMTSTQAAASYSDSAKTFHFFTDGGNGDYGKMAHADLLLYKFTDDNSADADYVTIAANAGVSGSSGTIYVPSENGTFLTTATSYATAAINVATSASNYPINLKPHGTGYVTVGNGGATGKLSSNGAYDLILATNSGTNSSSIAITDAANGSISFIPNGTGEIVIGSGSASGKITSSGAHDLVLDTNAGSASSSITITDAANGDINLNTNGTGTVIVGNGSTTGTVNSNGNHQLQLKSDADTYINCNYSSHIDLHTGHYVTVGGGSNPGSITSQGANDLILNTNYGTNSSSIQITDAANGNISFIPNGTGKILVGSGSAAGVVTSSGAHDITVSTNSGTNSSYITITDAANGNINLVNNGTGEIVVGSGAAAATIITNGNHHLSLEADASTKIDLNYSSHIDLVTGHYVRVGSGSGTGSITSNGAYDLVLNTNLGSSSSSITITDAANGDITLACNGTGDIECSSDVKTSTTKKVYSKGNCIQTSFHSSLVFGY